MSEKTIKERKSNFELLRIFAIVAIIFSHFNIHSYFSPADFTSFNLNYFITNVFQIGVISNAIFCIISGYFLCRSTPKPRKIIKLIAEMYFYSILIFIGVKLFTHHEITIPELKETFLPFPFGNWYCVMYIYLYLLAPFFNKFIDSLKKEEMKKFLIIMFILFSIFPTIVGGPSFSRLAMFVFWYFVGAYIRLYIKEGIKKSKLIKYIAIFFSLEVISVLAIYLVLMMLNKPYLSSLIPYFLVVNASPLVLGIAVCIFLLFRELDIKQNKVINRISASTLGVYLIHENIFVRPFIWRKIATIDINNVNVLQLILFAIIKCLAIFIICVIIDQIRMFIFDRIKIGKKKEKK